MQNSIILSTSEDLALSRQRSAGNECGFPPHPATATPPQLPLVERELNLKPQILVHVYK